MRLLTFSNYIPEQIADTVRFIQHDGLFRQSHYCQYVQNFISLVQEDTSLDGAILPNSCDSSRSVIDYLDGSKKYIYQLKHPTVINDNSYAYFAHAIEAYKDNIEKYFKQTITIESILEKTDMLRERGQYLYDIYTNYRFISYDKYIEGINKMLSGNLIDWKKNAPCLKPSFFQGKRVYVIGPFIEKPSIFTQMERSGLHVVGDNLTNSKRIMWKDYKVRKESIFYDIAYHILNTQASVTVDTFSSSWNKDYDEIKRKNVQGVIFLCKKFCEPYDYLYTLYQQRLEEIGIPILKVYVDNTDVDVNSSVWETFSEMI